MARERMTHQQLTLMVQNKNLRTLLDDNPAFRRFCWTIINQAGIYYQTHSPRSPYDTAYMEGRRALGLEVLGLLKGAHPSILALMEVEGNLLGERITATNQEDDNDLPPDDAD